MNWTPDMIMSTITHRLIESEIAACKECGERSFVVWRVGPRRVLLYICRNCEANYHYGRHDAEEDDAR